MLEKRNDVKNYDHRRGGDKRRITSFMFHLDDALPADLTKLMSALSQAKVIARAPHQAFTCELKSTLAFRIENIFEVIQAAFNALDDTNGAQYYGLIVSDTLDQWIEDGHALGTASFRSLQNQVWYGSTACPQALQCVMIKIVAVHRTT